MRKDFAGQRKLGHRPFKFFAPIKWYNFNQIYAYILSLWVNIYIKQLWHELCVPSLIDKVKRQTPPDVNWPLCPLTLIDHKNISLVPIYCIVPVGRPLVIFKKIMEFNLLKFLLLISARFIVCQVEFKSAPTTVKAPENDTILLPCYLETTTNGEDF